MSARVRNLYKDRGHCTVAHKNSAESKEKKTNQQKKKRPMVQKITNFHLNQARKTENEGVMIESERQSKRYASGRNRDSER